MNRPGRRRLRRWLLAGGIAVVLLLGAAIAVLRLGFHGEALADRVTEALGGRMRGRLAVRSIEWDLGSLTKVVTGGWAPVTVRGVEVWDDGAVDGEPDGKEASRREPRLVFRSDKITAEIDVHAAMFGRHDVVLRNVVVHGGWAKLHQTAEPYPLHDYDKTIVSLISAFYPKAKPSFAAGLYASAPPPVFDLRDVHLRSVGLEVWIAPSERDQLFAGVLTLRDLDADGFLYMDASDPVVSKLYFGVTPTAKSGTFEVLRDLRPGRPRAEYTFELEDVVVERLAQLPTAWPDSTVANSLEVALTARTPQGASLRLAGDIDDYWARPYDGSWDMTATFANLGPTLSHAINPALRGEQVAGVVRISGPFVAPPRIAWEQVRGLEYDLALSEEEAPLRLILGELNGAVDFVNDTGKLERTVALVAEGDAVGKIQLDGTFDLAPYQPHLTIAVTEPIDLGRFIDRWLPPAIGRARGHYLSGSFVLDGDPTVSIGIDDVDLELRRTRTGGATTSLRGGEIVGEDELERFTIRPDRAGRPLTVSTGGTELRISGTSNARAETIDLAVVGSSSELGWWLARFGAPPIARRAERAAVTIRGPIASPVIDVDARLGQVEAVGSLEVAARLEDRHLELTSLRSAGLGGDLRGRGAIELDGPGGAPYLALLAVEGRGLSAERLASAAGQAPVVRGTIDELALRARGSLAGRREPMDWLALAQGKGVARQLEVAGEAYQDIGVCLNLPTERACLRPEAPRDDDDLDQCKDAVAGGGACVAATASRVAGGVIDAVVSQAAPRRGGAIGGTIALTDLPTRVLGALTGTDVAVGGTLSTALHLGGDRDAPDASGLIALARGWIGSTFVGDVDLKVAPAAPGTIRIAGAAFGGQVEVTADIGLRAPYPTTLACAAAASSWTPSSISPRCSARRCRCRRGPPASSPCRPISRRRPPRPSPGSSSTRSTWRWTTPTRTGARCRCGWPR
ncbi:MAG: hypothetical protein R2939_13395 [Kofleriaceae bacterium]